MYLVDNSYYKAAVLRLGNLDNADQRIVEDLNQFCGARREQSNAHTNDLAVRAEPRAVKSFTKVPQH